MTENISEANKFTCIDQKKIVEMLYGDKKYITEFCDAAIQSFNEFSESYRKYLLAEDETLFRKAGHKIKPIAQMIGVLEIVEEYEHGKELVQNQGTRTQYNSSAKKIEGIVDEVIKELEMMS